MKVELRLSGAEQMARALHALPAAVERRVLRNAMRRAGKPIEAAGRAMAPKFSGLLGKSTGAARKIHWYAHSATMYLAIGPRTGYRKEVGLETKRIAGFDVSTGRYRALKKSSRTSGRTRVQNPVHYAHIVERGRKGVVAGTGRNSTAKALYLYGHGVFLRRAGPAAGKKFLERAWQASGSTVMRTLENELLAGVEREAAALSVGSK